MDVEFDFDLENFDFDSVAVAKGAIQIEVDDDHIKQARVSAIDDPWGLDSSAPDLQPPRPPSPPAENTSKVVRSVPQPGRFEMGKRDDTPVLLNPVQPYAVPQDSEPARLVPDVAESTDHLSTRPNCSDRQNREVPVQHSNVSALQRKVAELELQNASLSEDNRRLGLSCAEKDDQVESLKARLCHRDHMVEKLETESKENDALIRKMRAAVADAERAKVLLQNEIVCLRSAAASDARVQGSRGNYNTATACPLADDARQKFFWSYTQINELDRPTLTREPQDPVRLYLDEMTNEEMKNAILRLKHQCKTFSSACSVYADRIKDYKRLLRQFGLI